MKLPLLLASLLTSATALACYDPNATPLNHEQIEYYAEHSPVGFAKCLDKLAAEGVDMKHLAGSRAERKEGDTGPVAYTVMVQGNDGNDHPVRIYIEYNLNKKNFTCEEPTRAIPRCL